MKKFVVKLQLLIPILIAILALNIYIDPGMIITHKMRITKIAQFMISGRNVGMVAMPSAASFLPLKKIVADSIVMHRNRKLDIAVLGSSRSSEINAGLFPGKTFFNFSVGRAHIADYIEIYGYLKSQNIKPEIVIIGIDPWIGEFINSDSSDYYNDTLLPLLSSDAKPVTLANSSPFKNEMDGLKEFCSPSYAQSAFMGLIGLLRAHRVLPLFATEKDCGIGLFIIRDDGSYSLKCASSIDDEKVNAVSVAYAYKNKGHVFGEKYVANKRFNEVFEAFIRQLEADNVKPVLFIAPIQPAAFNILLSGEPDKVEAYFKTLANKNRIPVIGSFNAMACRLPKENNLFLDQYHPSSIAVAKMFDKIDIGKSWVN